jgi:hypothetical protein
MEIHKPKPWRGFREFFKEYLIIVIGVLTALGAEQFAESLHWRHQVHLAREALAFDLRRVIGQAATKDAEAPCVAARLAQLTEILDQAQRTKMMPPLGYGGEAAVEPWTMRAWAGLTFGQGLAHMPNREQLLLSAIAGQLEYLRELRTAEQTDWAKIDAIMVGTGRATSDAEIAELRLAIGDARAKAGMQRSLSRETSTLIVSLGFLTDSKIKAAYDEGVALGRRRMICRPIPAPGANPLEPLDRRLLGDPVPPGKSAVGTVGVGGAVSTER